MSIIYFEAFILLECLFVAFSHKSSFEYKITGSHTCYFLHDFENVVLAFRVAYEESDFYFSQVTCTSQSGSL